MEESEVFTITSDHDRWVKNAAKKYKGGQRKYRDLVEEQKGRCAFSDVPLLFDAVSCNPNQPGGCHPLSASVDHLDPKKPEKLCIVCQALNDIKGQLPYDCFKALQGTPAWQDLMAAWREIAESNAKPEMFKTLIEKWPKGLPAMPARKLVQILVPETMTHVGGSSLESRARTEKVDERSIVKALTTNDYHENWYFEKPEDIEVRSIEDYPAKQTPGKD